MTPRTAAPAWAIWFALGIVYVVWGSTYLASRLMVETVPPLLGAGVRFVVAGALMLAVLALRRGVRSLRLTRRELIGALAIGTLLSGANAVVTVAVLEVPSGLASLLFAAVPLWVVLLRTLARERVSTASALSVLVGFLGAALLLRPGEQSGEASVLGLLACVGAALMNAGGSFALPRIVLPRDPFISAAWQMLLSGVVVTVAGLGAGELAGLDLTGFSGESIAAFAYLVIMGSIVAYTAYVWLLDRAPLSRVSTYAYVNPVVALALGWLVVDEVITGVTLLGAAIVLVSVSLIIRIEADPVTSSARPASGG